MDGADNCVLKQGLPYHTAFAGELETTVEAVINGGGDLVTLRAHVRQWVEQYASYPCRTALSESGISVYYTLCAEDGGLKQQCILIPCDQVVLSRYHTQNEHSGW